MSPAPQPPAAQGVTAGSPPPVEQNVLPGSPESARALAMAALAMALTAADQAGPHGEGDSRLAGAAAVVQQAAGESLPPREAASIQRLLSPVPIDGPTVELEARLREWIGDAVLPIEARLRALLETGAAGEPLDARLASHLRVLLGRLQMARGQSSAALDPASPGRQVNEEAPEGEADPVSRAIALVADRLLGQQARLVHDWLAQSTLAFELPLRWPRAEAEAEEARARVAFRREPGAAGGGEGQRPCTLGLHIESATFGAVEVSARWQGRSCRASFFVEREEAARALDTHLESLRTALAPVFPTFDVAVVLDPARARPRGAAATVQLPSGSIVSVRT